MIVCIIPARGGSKRIPRKNIKIFAGRPMIGWSIEAATNSGLFDKVLVSTDDEEIAAVARNEGAEVPFSRPAELSDDHAGTLPVVAHAVEELGLAEDDCVCCLYATAPFVTNKDLAEGLRQLESGAKFAIAVTTYNYPIQRALLRGSDGAVSMMNPDQMQTRSQDLVTAWHDAGQFYWGRVGDWRQSSGVFGNGAFGVELPAYRVVDIDTPEDWERAETLSKAFGLAR